MCLVRATGLARSTDAVFYYEVGEREERQFGKVVIILCSMKRSVVYRYTVCLASDSIAVRRS